MLILTVNPGSTSTKLALFDGENERAAQTVTHAAEELAGYATMADQLPMRLAATRTFLAESLTAGGELRASIGRGGLLHPVESGTYAVNDQMRKDLGSERYGRHASNLGGLIASAIAEPLGIPAFIADPVVVDELESVARLSGVPQIERRSIFHALNQKSAARDACAHRGITYDNASVIVAHMGGGVSVGAHRGGRVIDVNNALDGDGPFSPERAGTLPAGQLVELAVSDRHSEPELRRLLTGGGGLVAYTGSNSLKDLRQRAEAGDAAVKLALEAMSYQIAKEIASHGATLAGAVDLIVLTGGMAHDSTLIREISERIGYLAPIEVIPGEREMLSLARAAVRALEGEEEVREYR